MCCGTDEDSYLKRRTCKAVTINVIAWTLYVFNSVGGITYSILWILSCCAEENCYYFDLYSFVTILIDFLWLLAYNCFICCCPSVCHPIELVSDFDWCESILTWCYLFIGVALIM